jgi:hypothetical protein
MGVAELHEARALGVFHHAALERYGAQLVGLSAARPHGILLTRRKWGVCRLLDHDREKASPGRA